MRRAALLLALLVAGCGDGDETPPRVNIGFGASEVRDRVIYVGSHHSSSEELVRLTLRLDDETAKVGIDAYLPDIVNADRKFSCFRIPVDREIERVLRPDGSPAPAKPAPRDEQPTAHDDLQKALDAGGRCRDLPVDRSGDGL